MNHHLFQGMSNSLPIPRRCRSFGALAPDSPTMPLGHASAFARRSAPGSGERCRRKPPARSRLPSLPVLGLLFGVGAWGDLHAETPPSRVQVVSPRIGVLTRDLSLPAVVRPWQQVTLHAKVAGYLKSIAVDRGDRVKPGETLGEIEAPEMFAELEKARADLAVAELESKRLNEAARRAPDLVLPNTVDAAKGRMEIARGELSRLETLLAYAHLEAPFAGIITKRWVDPGAFIPAATSGNAPQSAAVVTLMDFSRVRIEVAVPESVVARVAPGLAVRITAPALPGPVLEGHVTRMAYALDPSTKTMAAEIDLPNPDLALRPGMFVEARFQFTSRAAALQLPGEAILAEKGQTHVLLARDGKVVRVPIKTGLDNGVEVEVIEGLQPGDAVILTGRQRLLEGAAVTIEEVK